VTNTVDFAPAKVRRFRFWVQIGAVLCAGVSAIAILQALHSPMKVMGITSALRNPDSANTVPNAEPQSPPTAIFADRFAFGAVDGTSAHSGRQSTEPSRFSSAHRHVHWHYRHKTNHHKLGRLAHAHRRPYEPVAERSGRSTSVRPDDVPTATRRIVRQEGMRGQKLRTYSSWGDVYG